MTHVQDIDTMTLIHLLFFGLVLLAASSVPFIPTGEAVSGAAALAAPSVPLALTVFAVSWVCSCVGDTVLLSGSRLFAGRVQRWRQGRPANPKGQRAEQWLRQSTLNTVITARLIPGMRAPVIVALGLSGLSRRAFVRADVVACGIWAAVYTLLGSVGGRLTSHPLLAVAVAVVLAVSLSSLGGLVVHRIQTARAAHRDEVLTSQS